MNYGGSSGQQQPYGQQQMPMQQNDYSGMKMNNGQNNQSNPNYYTPNIQQNQMMNQRKCSAVVGPDQLALNQQMNTRKYSTATAPDFMDVQQNQMINPRKCSTVVGPDQIRMQKMMPPPSSHHNMQQNSQQIQQRRFSQQQPQMQNLMPSMHQQSSSSNQTSSPHLMSSSNQPQQSSPNFMPSPQMMQIPPNHQNSPIQHHKNSLQTAHLSPIPQQNMGFNQMQNQQNSMAMGQQNMANMQANQHKNSLQHQNSIPHQYLSPIPNQQNSNFNQMSQQQVSQNHNSPIPQHKYSLQHQRSISSSQHLSPHPTQQQISPNQQQMISPVSQQQQFMQHMSLQNQSSMPPQSHQFGNMSMQPVNPSYHPQQHSNTTSSYNNILRDCTPPPQLQSYKMDQSSTQNPQYNFDIPPNQPQQQAYGNHRVQNSMELESPRQAYPQQNQLPPNPTQSSNFMHKSQQQCSQIPTASDDFYVRSDNYTQQQSWRKASLACNFRLNPTRKESSISPNVNPANSSNRQSGYNYDQMQPNRTTSCAFNEPPKLRENSNSYNPNFAHRSQSLSAAEFLRRHGSSDCSTGAQVGNSLRRFSSQLRTHKPSNVGILLNKHPSLATLYTPPPILSPMRSGSGLYRSISRQERKISSLVTALSLKKHMEEDQDSPSTSKMGPNTEANIPVNGQISRKSSSIKILDQDAIGSQNAPMFTDLEQARASLTGRKPFIRPPMDNRANAPQRKNGLFLSGAAQGSDGSAFAAELEALRKESASSTQSNQESASRRMSIVRNSKLSLIVPNHDEVLRKLSSTSIDEPSRKLSSTSDTYYDYTGLDSDITPHINLGKNFQARVKKWSPRGISDEEREAIPDRDDMFFDNKVIEHIPQRAVAAYEALSCSQAVPRPGRNKELALHILMENQGNLQAAVMDLLRCDTLDWEQYPIIYKNLYLDVDMWTPEDIASFQDAIYKSEKDFHQVSSELGNRSVKQCIGFYYTWKKCCPDDYRKLRNLRRKRLLLEQQLDYSNFTDRQRTQSESQAQGVEVSDEESDLLESDATSVASITFNRPYSPYEDSRGEKYPRLALGSPLDQFKAAASSQHFADIAAMKAQQQHHEDPQNALVNAISAATSSAASNFPWLHGEFPSPGSSNANSSYSQPASVGSLAMDLFIPESSGGMPILHQKTHRPSTNKKGAQPSADGFFHCRLCEKRFEKVKSLNAHMKSHAMKARAEAEAQSQLQNKHQKQQQNQMSQQSPLSMALGAAVRLQQQQQGNFSGHHGRIPEDASNDDRSPNESLSPLNFLTSGAVQQQQNQQQQQAFLRLFGGHNPFSAAQQIAAANDAAVSQAMNQLTAAQFAFGQQPPPDLQNVLAQMPTTQANQNAATTLEQLHLQQNHLQHSATIMH